MARELAQCCAADPNLMRSWTVAETKKLIQCVKMYKNLYDPDDSLYRNEDSEREAFENIAKVFNNKSDFQCLGRWLDIDKRMTERSSKGLEYYSKELDLIVKTRSGITKSEGSIYSDEIDISEYEVIEDTVPTKTAAANASFFRCVLESVKKLSPCQQSTFKIAIMNQLHYLLHEKPFHEDA